MQSKIKGAQSCCVAKNETSNFLKEKTIYELDIASIIAGTKYRGEFEEKLKKILKRNMTHGWLKMVRLIKGISEIFNTPTL